MVTGIFCLFLFSVHFNNITQNEYNIQRKMYAVQAIK